MLCRNRLQLVFRFLTFVACYLSLNRLLYITEPQAPPDGDVFEYTWATAWLHTETAVCLCIMIVAILGWNRSAFVTAGVTGAVVGFLITQPMKALSDIGTSRWLTSVMVVIFLGLLYKHLQQLTSVNHTHSESQDVRDQGPSVH